MNHGKISPGPWLTSLHVSWISHILLKKSIFKSGEPIKALNKTRIIQTKTNKVQSRYLPSLLTGTLPKSEIQFENDIFLCGAYIPPNNTTPTITTKMDYFQKLNEMLIRYKDKGNILIMRDPLTKKFTNV